MPHIRSMHLGNREVIDIVCNTIQQGASCQYANWTETFFSAKVDFLIQTHWGIASLEVDENMHSPYSSECEVMRMVAICRELSRHGIVHFIRYNPDRRRECGMRIAPSDAERAVAVQTALRFAPTQFTISYIFYSKAHVPFAAVHTLCDSSSVRVLGV